MTDRVHAYAFDLPPALRLALAPAQLGELERLVHELGAQAAAIAGRPVVGVDIHFRRIPSLVATPRLGQDAA